jgi:membrane associated rhomboid family serine protease
LRDRQPIFNAPAVVVALLGAFVAVHLVRSFLSDAADEQLIQLWAFDPARLKGGGGLLAPAGGWVATVTQFVTHVLTHGDVAHLLLNSAWFMAFATPVTRRIGNARFLAFFLLCGIGGALAYLPFNDAPMVGASGAISGLMGAAVRFLLVPLIEHNIDALSGEGPRAPLMSLSAALSDKRVLIAIAVWTLLNLAFAWIAPLLLGERNIAWEAHVGGFLAGFLTFGWFDPPAPEPPVHHDSAPAE